MNEQDRILESQIKMILQAYRAEFIDRFRAWEEIQKAVQVWKESQVR